MRLGTATAVAALLATSILTGAHSAAAADLPSYYAAPAADEQVAGPQEFGAGWYLLSLIHI